MRYDDYDMDDEQEIVDDPFADGKELDFSYPDEDDIDDIDDDEYTTLYVPDEDNTGVLVNLLRKELKKPEYARSFLRFRYRDEVYDGIPMAEIRADKFVFKVENTMMGINLSEIKIL